MILGTAKSKLMARKITVKTPDIFFIMLIYRKLAQITNILLVFIGYFDNNKERFFEG